MYLFCIDVPQMREFIKDPVVQQAFFKHFWTGVNLTSAIGIIKIIIYELYIDNQYSPLQPLL